MEEIKQFAKEHTLETGSHPPTVFVKGTERNIVIPFSDLPDTSDGRVQTMFLTVMQLSREKSVGNLKQVCFVTEGWMAPVHNGKFIQPSKDPERIEALLFSCLDVDENKQTLEALRMVRNPEGKLTDLWILTMPKDVEVQSNLLPAFVSGYKSISRAS